jgi:hypothetical protein
MEFFNSVGPGRWPGQNWEGTQSHILLFLLDVTGSSLEAMPDLNNGAQRPILHAETLKGVAAKADSLDSLPPQFCAPSFAALSFIDRLIRTKYMDAKCKCARR